MSANIADKVFEKVSEQVPEDVTDAVTEAANDQVQILVSYTWPIEDFLYDWHVRVTWIALSTLFVLWGLCWVIRHVLNANDSEYFDSVQKHPDANAVAAEAGNATATVNAAGVDPAATAAGTTAEPSNAVITRKLQNTPPWLQQTMTRMDRCHDLMRDLLLMLLTVLVINTFARGSTSAAMIIAWIFVIFAIIFMLVETVFKNAIVRLTYTLIFYALSLAILGLAWFYGF
ncbi:hypothetical protein BC940DRAFT_316961 [Gongronella butleri]|nr:hypothetical protein BC940DRAFT_316961 [Gongronella butleri]